jgi:hypothetical protein
MPAPTESISHWHHSVEGLSTSSRDFYGSIEEALKAKEAPIRTERIQVGEGGLLSAKREYLRVAHDRFAFDIGAAPFGKDFFFSWWLGKRVQGPSAFIGCMTVVGFLARLFACVTMAGFMVGSLVFLVLLLFASFYLRQTGDITAEDIVLSVPIIGPLYARFFKPLTYYTEDTRQMFEETVSRVVQDVLAGMLTVNNLKPLTPDEARPKSQPSK